MPMPTAMVTAVRPLARAMGRGVRRASAAGAASPPPPPDFGALADDVVRCLREGGVPPAARPMPSDGGPQTDVTDVAFILISGLDKSSASFAYPGQG